MQPIACLEFLENRTNVSFHGAFRNTQLSGNFLVTGATGNRASDFLFASRQSRQAFCRNAGRFIQRQFDNRHPYHGRLSGCKQPLHQGFTNP